MRVRLRTLVVCGVAGALAVASGQITSTLEQLILPPVTKTAWRFKQFPILAWWGPPGTAAAQDFVNYRDAGMNIYLANPDIGFNEAIKKATAAGLAIMPSRDKMGFDLKKADVDFPVNHPNVVGWFTGDEPSTEKGVIDNITMVNELMRLNPAEWVLFNCLPPHVNTPFSHRDAIAAAVKNGMPAISYDNYVIHQDGTDHNVQHFNNLKFYRQESLKHNVPFWAFALTIKHFHYRRASESDLRWKQYTNLAYGAKGLWYFTYWGPTDWEKWDTKAIVDPVDGAKTELYGFVKAINDNVQSVGAILLNLTSERVLHTSAPLGQKQFVAGKHWVSDIQAKDAIVSLFRHSDGARYAMVVNKQHGMGKSAAETSDTITIRFAPGIKRVDAVAWLDGTTGSLELKDQRATLGIAGGYGSAASGGRRARFSLK